MNKFIGSNLYTSHSLFDMTLKENIQEAIGDFIMDLKQNWSMLIFVLILFIALMILIFGITGLL